MEAQAKENSNKLITNVLFATILIAYIFYAAALIYSGSAEVQGERYFLLFDDAMISMRFAKNLAAGYGLLWNPGEAPVEGFTNMLWTLYMSFLHLFQIAESKICLAVQITALAIQIASICMVKKIAARLFTGNVFLRLLPVLLTAFYYPLNLWSLQGMEVGVLALILLVAASLIQDYINEESEEEHSKKNTDLLFLLFFIAILIRMDSAVPLLATVVFLLIFDYKRRLRNLTAAGLSLTASCGILELYRFFYYHDLLPNTYYLKVQGYPPLLRIGQGAYNLAQFILKSNPWLFAIAGFGLLKNRSNRFLFYPAFIVAAQMAYSVYVGGDAWEDWGNRYITQAMPLFFLLFVSGIDSLAKINLAGKAMQKMPKIAAILISVLSVFSFNNIAGLKNLFLLEHPVAWQANKNRLELSLSLRKVLDKDAHVAATLCGILPYFVNRNCIDMLGKCDPVVAKEEMHDFSKIVPEEMSWRWFYPGHMKWDYKHSIGELSPDVVVELWALPQEAEPYLKDKYKKMTVDGFPVYLKLDSKHIDWSSKSIAEFKEKP